MSRPRVLLLDEPTSGLDSFAAAVVVGHVAALAAGHTHVHAGNTVGDGVTVIASLHQPRAAIWEQVNQVVVMGRGRLLYCGQPCQLLPWFRDYLGYYYDPEQHGMVPDWIMDLVALPGTFTIGAAAAGVGNGNGNNGNGSAGNGKEGPAKERRWTGKLMGGQRTAVAPSSSSASGIGNGGGSTRTSSSGSNSDGGASGGQNGGGAGTCRVMASLHDLYDAADAFEDAVLSLPPAPGVSSGVPDYANVVAEKEQGGGTIGEETDAAAGATQGLPTGQQQGMGAADNRGFFAAASSSLEVWFRQFRMLVWREWLMATRNPADVAGRMLTFVWVGLFSNFLAYDLPSDATSIALRGNLLFALCFFFLVMPFVFMSLFSADKRFFLLEASARGGGGAGGLYTPSAYYAAKVTATAPLNMAIAITFAWIGYGMLGFRRSVMAVAQSTACAVIMALISLQWVQAAVAFSSNQDLAFCASVAFAVLNLLFSTQFLGSVKLTFAWIGRLRSISALDHTWRGLVRAEFGNRAFVCGPEGSTGMLGTDALGLYPQFLPNNPRFNLIRYGMTTPSENCVVDTNSLLSYYGITTSVGNTVGYLIAYLAVVHLITYLSLRHAAYAKSKGLGVAGCVQKAAGCFTQCVSGTGTGTA